MTGIHPIAFHHMGAYLYMFMPATMSNQAQKNFQDQNGLFFSIG